MNPAPGATPTLPYRGGGGSTITAALPAHPVNSDPAIRKVAKRSLRCISFSPPTGSNAPRPILLRVLNRT
jgi:hypothetical protein